MNTNQIHNLYKLHIKNLVKSNGTKYRGNCPFHDENTPINKSFAVDIETGQYYCHSCGAKGNAIIFARYFGEDEKLYYDYKTNDNYSEPVDSLKIIYSDSKDWCNNMDPIWDIDLLKSLRVGWCEHNKNYVFNIFNESGKTINVKHHKGKQTAGAKATLYPYHLIKSYNRAYVIITEGEKDAITLLSNGFQAITSTGGALTIPTDITILKDFERVYLCFDNDDAGDKGIDRWIKKLKSKNLNWHIRTCDMSKYVDNGGDVTDYFHINAKDRDSFIKEILSKSRYAKKSINDQPDLLREITSSEHFKNLSVNDQNIFFNLFRMACRYRGIKADYNGITVWLNPGEFVKSNDKLAKLCGKGMTARMVHTSLEHLQKQKFLSIRKLKCRKGKIFKICGWNDEFVQGPCTIKLAQNVKEEFPFFRLRENIKG